MSDYRSSAAFLHLGLVVAAGIYLPQWPATLRYLLVVILLGVSGLQRIFDCFGAKRIG